eukprot:2726404-Pleurochrysis_carterae.AAC.1
MQNANHWDLFLEYVKEVQSPWAPPEADTGTYRKMRAVRLFNAGKIDAQQLMRAPTRSTR